jgi:hypothetical protein
VFCPIFCPWVCPSSTKAQESGNHKDKNLKVNCHFKKPGTITVLALAPWEMRQQVGYYHLDSQVSLVCLGQYYKKIFVSKINPGLLLKIILYNT